jgi:DNA mismatch repair protein MutS2
MRLEDYWGVGPKTSALLAEALGHEAAIEAIESADVRALVDAGLPRGRATRILRHAHGGAMDLLATRDARAVYKDLLDLIGEFAVSADAADRVGILTPLDEVEAMVERVDRVLDARDDWAALDGEHRQAVLDAFERDDATDGRRGAVETALALRDLGFDDGVFAPVGALDGEALARASDALAGLAGEDGVGSGADADLDALREQVGRVEDLAAAPAEVTEAVTDGARGHGEFHDAFVRHVADETGVDRETVRTAAPDEAADASDYVAGALRALAAERRKTLADREARLASDLEATLEETADAVAAAVDAVEEVGLILTLGRFAAAHDLTAPTYVDDREVLALRDARNLFLERVEDPVQPVSYAVGDHDLAYPAANAPPSGDRVTVLTGANSGGKTTLLETCCLVQVLAQMGLPVPAATAEVGPVDAVVFHRRHASFNAGVLEATLRTVVPPLVAPGRTLMLVDEFEAITEPGRAADLLHGLVSLSVDEDALGLYVTHLAEDLEPLPAVARTDGIFAEGLTPSLSLEVDYQPRFGTVGKSTPEFIVSRLVAEADDATERAGYQALAAAVGEEAVQRTLADARWSE